jgi:hypothetical protein
MTTMREFGAGALAAMPDLGDPPPLPPLPAPAREGLTRAKI